MFLKRFSLLILLGVIFTLFLGTTVCAQITEINNSTSTPIQGAGHDYIRAFGETVNPANGSVSLRLHVPVPPGRQLTLPFSFAYDSNGAFTPQGDGTGNIDMIPGGGSSGDFLSATGWSYAVPLQGNTVLEFNFVNNKPTCDASTGYVFHDANGSRSSFSHLVGFLKLPNFCVGHVDRTSDAGSDPFYSGTLDESSVGACGQNVTVTDFKNTKYFFTGQGCVPSDVPTYTLPTSVEDRNGNVITVSNPNGGAAFTFQDTLGRTVLASSGFGSTGDTITIAGLAHPYTLTWATTRSSYAPHATAYNAGVNCASAFGAFGTSPVVSALALPNGRSFQFSYDTASGLVNKITYPSGGYISYTWAPNPQSEFGAFTGLNNAPQICSYTYDTMALALRYVSFDGSTIAEQQDFSYSTTWNSSDITQWTSKQTTVTTYDLVRGTSSQIIYTYTPIAIPTSSPLLPSHFAAQIPVEQTVVYKDGNGNTLRTVNKTWYDQYEIKSVQTVLDNGQSSMVNYTWGIGGLTEKDEFDFGQSSIPTRKTVYSYGGGFDQPCKTIIYDGNGNRLAETDVFFDGSTTLCGAGGQSTSSVSNLTGHDETNYGPSLATPRGNITKTVKQCFQGSQACAGGNAITTYTFDETGNILSSTDANGNVTNYSYADNYASGTGTPPADTNAFLTQITLPATNGVAHMEKFSYGYLDGQLRSAIDQNNQTTSYAYNDPFLRPTQINNPDGGQTTISYNDSPYSASTPSPSVTTTKKITSSMNVTTLTAFDGMGQTVRTVLSSDPDCSSGDRTDTTYDGLGRVYKVSNPYCTTSDATYGVTTTLYDALGRATQITQPDGNTVLTTYTGRASEVQDEGNGSQRVTRISQTDAYGRLVSVCEVSSATLIGSGGTPGACGQDIAATGFLTTYQYDPLGNLIQVNQPGIAGRTFAYDSLSRLTSATNPESGTITYSYDANDNVVGRTSPAPNQTSGATATVSYCFDALNRMTAKAYTFSPNVLPACSNGTLSSPVATYSYDAAPDGLSITNPVGRLVKQATNDGQTAEVNSYDAMGRIVNQWQCTPQNCGTSYFSLGYSYDINGDLTSSTNGAGVTLTYGYTTAGRLRSLTSNFSDANHPAALLSGVTYNALAESTSATMGNGLSEALGYGIRGWLETVSAQSSSGGTATPASGSVNFTGTLQSKGTGSVNVSGSEQSSPSSGTKAMGSVTVSGFVQTLRIDVCFDTCIIESQKDPGGTVSITVNGHANTVNYNGGSTANSIAVALINQINGDSGAFATAGGPSCGDNQDCTISLVARTPGPNYSLSAQGQSNDDADGFTSFDDTAASGSTLTGGVAPGTTFDSGTLTVTVNGTSTSVSYGSSSNTTNLAQALARALNSGSLVSASASGTMVTMIANVTNSNYSLAVSSSSSNSSLFNPPSFSLSASGSALSPIYDSGNSTVAVNGHTNTISWSGSGTTPASIASALVMAINGDSGAFVTASSSGSTLSLTSKATGIAADYSLSASVSYDTGHFSSASFAVSSGSALTGGTNNVPYSLSLTYAPNGAVMTANDSANGNWAYGYDGFNRLTCSNQNSSICPPTSGSETYTYVYDRFGNRWQQNGPNSMQLTFTGNNPTSPANNNRMDGYTYDSGGNLLNDKVHSYFYDAENRLIQVDGTLGTCSAATACYVYDAEGRRIRKTTGSTSVDYLYDLGEHAITELSSTGAWNRGEVYAGTRHLATYNNGTTYFIHKDHLGTERARTNVSASVVETCASLPFGDGLSCMGTDASPLHFTGKERDSESGLDHFGFRDYSSGLGRFMKPDDGSDQSLGDPQSWNLYGYVRNNPIINTDPDGHDCVVQTRTGDNTESFSVSAGTCDGVKVGDGQSATYVPGTVNRDADGNPSIRAGQDGRSIDIGYTPYEGGGTGVFNAAEAPYPDYQGAAYGFQAAGYQQLAVSSRVANALFRAEYDAISFFFPITGFLIDRLAGTDDNASSEAQAAGVSRKPGSLGEFKGTDALRQENKVARDVMKQLKLGKESKRLVHEILAEEAIQAGRKLTFQEALAAVKAALRLL